MVEPRIISIGQSERDYLNSLYTLKKAETKEAKITLLKNRLGYETDVSTSKKRQDVELNALELALIDEEK